MAIVEKLEYHAGVDRYVTIIFDDDYIDVSIATRPPITNYFTIEFVNGYMIDETIKSNITIKRTDRADLVLGVIDGFGPINDPTKEYFDEKHLTKFSINAGVNDVENTTFEVVLDLDTLSRDLIPDDNQYVIENIELLGGRYSLNLDYDDLPAIYDKPLTLELQADDGYHFTGTIVLQLFDDFNSLIFDDVIPYNQNIGAYILDYSGSSFSIEINARTIQALPDPEEPDPEEPDPEEPDPEEPDPEDPPISTGTDFVNIYNVTKSALNQLAGTRFENADNITEFRDYGDMIVNLISIPFEIPRNLIQGIGSIMLAMKDTEINARVLNDYKLVIDLGKIEVSESEHNLLDYYNVESELYLPLLNSIQLDINYVMNQTISIEYVINLYSGDVTVNLYSTFTDSLFHTETQQIGQVIPFPTSRYESVNQTGAKAIYNNIKIPYIIIIKDSEVENNHVMGVNTAEVDTLGNHIGYIEVSDINLDTKATQMEQSEIKNLLANGVYINE